MAETLLSPRDGVPRLADTPVTVQDVAASLRSGHGPVAVDTERASGFRFDDRAFLVQLRRSGSGTHLVDPAVVPDAGSILAPVMNETPWILHAAHSDLPALTTLGWQTPQLHDTQIAGRLLGHGQIGLAGMLEKFLGVTVAKDKGREDWSARPVPRSLLTYAALDVELLIDLLEITVPRLEELGRDGWYRQECDHVSQEWSRPVPQPDWRSLRGLGHIRDRRGLEIVRRMVEARTEVARHRDVPPEHVLKGSAILELAQQPSRADRRLSGEIAGSSRLARSSGGGSRRSTVVRELNGAFSSALRTALEADSTELPERPRSPSGHPDHRTWARDYPVPHQLATGFRGAVDEISDATGIKAEDVLTVRVTRAVAWQVFVGLDRTGASDDPVGDAEESLGGTLVDQGCRDWQVTLLINAFLPVVAATLS